MPLKNKLTNAARSNQVKLTAKALLDSILDRPIAWIAWEKMPAEARRQWSAEAEALLNNRVFVSLCGRDLNGEKTNGELVKDLIEHAARYAEDFDGLHNVRMKIAGIELIRDRALEMLLPPLVPESKSDLNSTF